MSGKVLSAEDFPAPKQTWGSPIEQQVRWRISLSVCAYAYEIADTPICSDMMFDWMCSKIDKAMGTCHPILDEFFAYHFSPMTGMWIHQHPELAGIKRTFTRYYNVMRDYYERPGVQQTLQKRQVT